MVVVENEKIIEYDEFINIGAPLPQKITDLTGITDEMLLEYGRDEKTVAMDLKEILEPGSLMIAHNCQFDLLFIYHLLKRHFPDEADSIVESMNWIDTVTVLKDRKDYPHKLIDAVNYYNIPEVNFHRAIDDTKALYEVYLAMKAERDDLDEYINIFGYNPKWGVSGERFLFIEYKDQPYHNQGFLSSDKILPKK